MNDKKYRIAQAGLVERTVRLGINMRDTECPYCGSDVEINHDDGYGYSEDELHQQECGNCDKTFTYWTSIYFSYSTNKADCLNGGEHNYRKTITVPVEYTKLRCEMCGDEKPLSPNAKLRRPPETD